MTNFNSQPSSSVLGDKNKKINKKFIIISVVLVVAVMACAGAAYYFYSKYQTAKNPNAQAQAEVTDLVAKVGKLMVLPTDDTPTVATIADVSKLKDQAFFKNSANGDKLLAYTKSMQAILYRPSLNKIIAVAPIVINNNTPTNGAPSTPTTPGVKKSATGTPSTPAPTTEIKPESK